MFNPMAFATPQQQAELARMQVFTKQIRYVIHTGNDGVEITLKTDDAEAAQLIPQLQEALVTSVTHMLYQMFAMEGERV